MNELEIMNLYTEAKEDKNIVESEEHTFGKFLKI